MTNWALTGRAAERLTIDAALGADSSYRGVAIVGAAGVGKTRLAHETAAAAAGRGWVIREVMGTTAARAIPMGVFAQWTDGAATDPLHLVRHVIDAVSSTPDNSPVLVVVDDAHLLDEISAFTVMQLVVRQKACVVATIRAGQVAPDAINALWKDRHVARLDVYPLSRSDTDRLLTCALGGPVGARCAERVWELTRGNALFIHQIVEHEVHAGRLTFSGQQWQWTNHATLPAALIDIVGVQVGELSQPIRDVIDLVAVAEPVELEYVEAICNSAAIEEAERRGLITISPTGDPIVRMGHPLYGEVQRTQSGPLRLSHLRGRLAHCMASTVAHREPADPLRLGVLWLESDLSPNQDILAVAAWTAIMRLDLALTERLAEAAIGAGAGIDVQILRAQMLILLNRGTPAAALLDSILTGELPDPLRATVVVLRAANLLWILSQPEESWNVIDDGLAVEAGVVAQALLAFRSVQLVTAARPTEALALAADVERVALPPMPAMLALWAQTIAAGDAGQSQRADELAREGYALAATAPEISYETVTLACFHVASLSLAGDLAQARMVAERTLTQQADMPGITRSVATAITGMAALYRGDLSSAVDCLSSAVAEFGAHGGGDGVSYHANGMSYQFLILHAEALARAGNAEAARGALTLMRQNRPPAWDYIESDNLLAAAWVAAAEGHPVEARRLANLAALFAGRHDQWAREVLALQTAVQFGEIDHAHVERLEHLVGVVDGPRAGLVARWARARLLDNGDDLLEVAAGLESIGDRIAAADAAAHATVAFTRHQRLGAAFAASMRARRITDECGAITLATRDAAVPLALTPREHEVAVLVGKGLTNKRIAHSLSLSARTIEGHVYRICCKFGVGSRNELAEIMTECFS
ncbi:LuxR C-terminal-related transcriptional regulator [Mycobacterium sp.]|uniref:helix-turn-helix transcriptional regulator n=1 Tax=Mycobacterium sp. TaxID=1785 RepID=UPI003D0B2D82